MYNAISCLTSLSCFRSGKGVLNQKSELQRAMQKHREVQSKKEMEKERQSTRSALEITLEKRARRLEEVWQIPSNIEIAYRVARSDELAKNERKSAEKTPRLFIS